MAPPASTEASDLKRRGRQRLIGAVALVALLVVFVPMLLDSSPRPGREGPSLDIPAKEPAAPLLVPPAKPGPQPEPAREALSPKPQAEPAKVAAATPAPALEAAKVVPAAPPKAPEPAPAAAAQPPKSGYAVQVGAFRDEAKLKQAREKLTAARVAHYTERLDVSGGGLTRLRAGPFPTREAAEAALATLRRSALDGKVVPLP